MVPHVGALGDAHMHVVTEVNLDGEILKDANVRLRTPPISESTRALLVQRNIRSYMPVNVEKGGGYLTSFLLYNRPVPSTPPSPA